DAEFTEKTKDAVAKLKETGQKAFKEKDKEALKELREQGEALRKTRGEYETKVKDLLKDDQKKTFEEALKARTGSGGRPGFPGGRFGKGGERPAVGGGLLPPDMQEKLKLTDEQK